MNILRKLFPLFLLLVLALPAAAQDKPTIAFLSLGDLYTYDVTELAVLDVLESYGLITALEHARLREKVEVEGEKLNFIWDHADFDLPTANLMIDRALDQEPDVLITLSTPITQIAVNAISDMDDPPTLLFASVYNPVEAGIVESACIKPAHVAGTLAWTPYGEILSLLLIQNPTIETVGTIFNSSEAASAYGADEIKRIAEEKGVTVLTAAVTDISEVNLAAESLVNRGVDAFVLPIDQRTGPASLAIIAHLGSEFGIPVFHPTIFAIHLGATIGSGFYHYYAQGKSVGIVLANYLNGDLDIATTAINEEGGTAIGVNMDMAFEQGIDLSDEIIERADAVVIDGTLAITQKIIVEMQNQGEIIPLEERQEADQALLASLACTPERIAEEQAALDA